jgi:hypothetical protein
MSPMVRLAILALLVLVVAHDLVYAAGHGIGHLAEALGHTGHDPYWRWVGVTGILAVVGLLVAAARHWRGLRRRLAQLRDAVPGQWLTGVVVRRPTRSEVALLWLRLIAIALPLFVAQENVEHYLSHAGHLPLLGVLTEREYLAALPAFGFVALLVAGAAAAVRVRLAGLERAVRIAERWSLPRAATVLVGHRAALDLIRPRTNSLATPDLGRAPPLASMI